MARASSCLDLYVSLSSLFILSQSSLPDISLWALHVWFLLHCWFLRFSVIEHCWASVLRCPSLSSRFLLNLWPLPTIRTIDRFLWRVPSITTNPACISTRMSLYAYDGVFCCECCRDLNSIRNAIPFNAVLRSLKIWAITTCLFVTMRTKRSCIWEAMRILWNWIPWLMSNPMWSIPSPWLLRQPLRLLSPHPLLLLQRKQSRSCWIMIWFLSSGRFDSRWRRAFAPARSMTFLLPSTCLISVSLS